MTTLIVLEKTSILEHMSTSTQPSSTSTSTSTST